MFQMAANRYISIDMTISGSQVSLIEINSEQINKTNLGK